jgi:hypothetical protein
MAGRPSPEPSPLSHRSTNSASPLTSQLARVPDLGQALRDDLQIAYDKAERRVEVSATVSEAVAEGFENAKALLAEGSSVVVTEIAGAQFVSRYHPRIVERSRLKR